MRRNGLLRCGAFLSLALVAAGCTSAKLPSFGFLNHSKSLGPPRIVPMKQAKFALVPLTGGPAESLTALTQAIKFYATQRGIAVVEEDDPSATYKMKGYVSAVGGKSGTILIYVFDVIDTNGNRVDRVSGQEASATSAPDPWASLPASTLTLAGQRTVDSLFAWLSRPGQA